MISLPRVENVKVANPFKVKANASTQLKTDKVDAEALAEKPSFLKPFQIPKMSGHCRRIL